jgi:hypothetical protein
MIDDKFYLTDNLFIEDNRFKFIKNNKETKINSLNWHHFLSLIGWNKLYKPWILKLNKLSESKLKNSPFAYIDCGDDGNCLFHCIAYAKSDIINNKILTQKDIRKIVANNISKETFNNIIEIYRIMENCNDFHEDWKPNSIKTLNDFKKELILGGNNYWGDHIIIQLLCQTLNINILILNTNFIENIYEKYNLLQEYSPKNKTIVLIYLDLNHFQLFGHYKDDMIHYLFDDNNLPTEIRKCFSL